MITKEQVESIKLNSPIIFETWDIANDISDEANKFLRENPDIFSVLTEIIDTKTFNPPTIKYPDGKINKFMVTIYRKNHE